MKFRKAYILAILATHLCYHSSFSQGIVVMKDGEKIKAWKWKLKDSILEIDLLQKEPERIKRNVEEVDFAIETLSQTRLKFVKKREQYIDPSKKERYSTMRIVVSGKVEILEELVQTYGPGPNLFNDQVQLANQSYSQYFLNSEEEGISYSIFSSRGLLLTEKRPRILERYIRSDSTTSSEINSEKWNLKKIKKWVQSYNSKESVYESSNCTNQDSVKVHLYRRKKGESKESALIDLNNKTKLSLGPNTKAVLKLPADCFSRICLDTTECFLLEPQNFFQWYYEINKEKKGGSIYFQESAPGDARPNLLLISKEVKINN